MKKEEFYKDAQQDRHGPLKGIKVLEATQTQAGPFCGLLLTDLGAESIKIDPPREGEIGRWVPPFIDQESTFFMTFNRNKRGITLNMGHPKGQALFKELAKNMDVIVQNYKVGTMERWGLGYEEVRKLVPNIIYASISGFGQYGPLSHRPSYDAVGQAEGGLTAVTGPAELPPTRTGVSIADDIAGFLAAFSIVCALYHREKTGQGQHIDISQQDSILYMSDAGLMMAEAGFPWPRLSYSAHPGASPFRQYLCKDGQYIFICVGLNTHWERLCRLMGREDLLQDEDFKTNPLRVKNRERIDSIVSAWTQERTRDEVYRLFDEVGLVCGRNLTYEQILKEKHIAMREMAPTIEHPTAGKTKAFGVAPKFSLTPGSIKGPAPTLGQHNQEVYGGLLGLSQSELENLSKEGVI